MTLTQHSVIALDLTQPPRSDGLLALWGWGGPPSHSLSETMSTADYLVCEIGNFADEA